MTAAKRRSCPECGSYRAQRTKLAYAQSVRHGDHYSSVSEFGKQLEPPQPRSSVFVPSLLAAFLYAGLLLYVAKTQNIWLPFAPWRQLSGEHWQYAAAIWSITGIVAIALAERARRWNTHVFPTLIKEYEQETVCLDCGARFAANTRQETN